MPDRAPTQRELFRQVWRLAGPIAGTNFLLRGTVIVDTAMVGRLSALSLAGMGIAQIPLFLSMAIMRGLGIGAQILCDLGVQDMILLSNTKQNFVGMEAYGLNIVEQREIK